MSARRRIIALVLSCCVATGDVIAIESDESVQILESPRLINDFELMSEEGAPFHLHSLRGTSALVFFGFTHCPKVCPATMHQLRLLDAALRNSGSHRPAVVMISIDGDRDTPVVMKAYLDPLSPAFIGLTGDPRAVRRIAESFSAVFFKGLPADKSGGYLVDHTSQVYLVDAEGRLRASFFEASVEQMAQSIYTLQPTD